METTIFTKFKVWDWKEQKRVSEFLKSEGWNYKKLKFSFDCHSLIYYYTKII